MKNITGKSLLITLIFLLLIFPLVASYGCDDDEGEDISCGDWIEDEWDDFWGCDDDDDYSSSYAPHDESNPFYSEYTPEDTYQLITNTAPTGGMSPEDYIQMFFYDPTNPLLSLYVPGYVYVQGLVYSKGKIKTMGPIRIIGGVIGNKSSSGSENQLTLEGGAMITTCPDYLQQKLLPPKNRFRVVRWSEVGTESTKGKATP